MKTSKWIKLIGILCILFGINELINSYLPITILLNEKGDILSNIPNWQLIRQYIGLIVASIYLLAGIFFILKKSFSMNLMYGALTISILYVLIPLLVPPYHSIPFFILIGPILDLVLLIGVYRIRKYYYDSPKEKV